MILSHIFRTTMMIMITMMMMVSHSLPPATSTLEGFYVDDCLQGRGEYSYEDGGVMYGTYVDGELNGPAQEFDGKGHLMFKGHYKDNSRCGECWIYYPVSHTLFSDRDYGKRSKRTNYIFAALIT